MRTRRLSTRSRTTLGHLRRSRSVALTTLLTMLLSIVGPLVPKNAQAAPLPVNAGNPGASLGSSNTGVQEGQTDLGIPETGPAAALQPN